MRQTVKLIILSAFIFAFSSAVNAQNIKVGGGLAYSTNIGNPGISLNGTYKFNEKIDIAPSFVYYFTKDYVNWKELNIDEHYMFMKKNDIDIYALGGLALTMVSLDFPSGWLGSGYSYSETYIGLNVGAGAIKNFGKFDVFAEAKYTIGTADHLAVTGGVLYRL